MLMDPPGKGISFLLRNYWDTPSPYTLPRSDGNEPRGVGEGLDPMAS